MIAAIKQALSNLTMNEQNELAALLGKRGFDLLVKAFGDEIGQLQRGSQQPITPAAPMPQAMPQGMPQGMGGVDPAILAQMLMGGR